MHYRRSIPTTTSMLGRHARIHLHHHRIPWVAYRTPHHIAITPLVSFHPYSRRQFSLTNITEPINKAVGQLPDVFQHTIPETILNLSESWAPASLPTYTTGIFVFAVLTRLCFFTPWAYWVCFTVSKLLSPFYTPLGALVLSSKALALTFPLTQARKRKWKLREDIEPRVLVEFVHGWGPPLKTKLMRERAPPAEVNKILSQNIDFRRDQLTKEANLTLPPTIIIPALFTLPVFIITTSVMYSAAALPQIAANPTINEMFISLAGSGQDISPALPIAIGVVSLLGLEVGTWGPKAIQTMRSSLAAQEKVTVGKEALEIKPNAIATGFFRFLSLARVPICVALPGTVNIYWFTSTLFGLVEAGVFTIIEHLRAPAYWGRNSPLLNLSPAVLKARGYDLSTKTPLERAGVTYTPDTTKSLKKQPLSLERGARAVFVKGFQAAQLLKQVSRFAASIVASVGTVILNPLIYWRKIGGWWIKMGKHYRVYWSSRFRRLRAMGLRDYWTWFGARRATMRRWSERRLSMMASWFAKEFQRAQIKEKIRKGEMKVPVPEPKWTTKAERKKVRQERRRIKLIYMAKVLRTAAFKAKEKEAAKHVPQQVIVGLQPPRKVLPRRDSTATSRKNSLFA